MGLRRLWHFILLRLHRIKVSDHQIALGFAAGAFVSFTPFLGLHFIMAALIALALRGNILASAAGTVVGNPLTFPPIFLATYNLGALIQGRPHLSSISIDLTPHSTSLWSNGPSATFHAIARALGPYLVPMTIGSIPLGLMAAAICYKLVRMGLTGMHHRRERRRLERQKSHPV